MYVEARKLSIIEAIIKTESDAVLKAVESIVEDEANMAAGDSTKKKFSEAVGILTADEAEAMKRSIEEHFETINSDDWK